MLAQFLTEQAFYQRLGLTREELRRRPAEEIEQYVVILNLLAQREAAERRRSEAQMQQARHGR